MRPQPRIFFALVLHLIGYLLVAAFWIWFAWQVLQTFQPEVKR